MVVKDNDKARILPIECLTNGGLQLQIELLNSLIDKLELIQFLYEVLFVVHIVVGTPVRDLTLA